MSALRAEPDAVSEASHAGAGAPCGVCTFMRVTTERRIFFLFAEGLSDPDVHSALAAAGGFCPRHARWMLHNLDGYRLADIYRGVLQARLERVLGHGTARAVARGACTLCETEQWAEDHGLWSIARGRSGGDPAVPRSPDGLCRPHLVALLGRWPWSRAPELRERLAALLEDPGTLPSSQDGRARMLESLLGVDLDARVRTSALPDEASAPWGGGAWTVEGLTAELEARRCPVCSALDFVLDRFFLWRSARLRAGQEDVDFDALCEAHSWDVSAEPALLSRAVALQVQAWRRYLAAIPTPEELPSTRVERRVAAALRAWSAWTPNDERREWRRPSPTAFVVPALRPGRTLRERREHARPRDACVACRAMRDTRATVLGLLAAALSTTAGREAYERSPGLCLRHLERAVEVWSPAAVAIATRVATGNVALLRWELAEAGRKSAWTARYEPAGLERSAWVRALTTSVGSTILQDRWLAREPG
jgi:hypothetical protein